MTDHEIVVDLGFGDAGKGVTVDLLCATGDHGAVVRANGGAQAAHNVVTPDGRHHTFAQFGAGTLAPNGPVPTHLSRFMVVDPFALASEAAHLASLGVKDPLSLLTVDRRALISTPWHQEANRARERARGDDRHGSCGMGVGETMAYALDHPESAPTVGDCATPGRLRRKLVALAEALGGHGPEPEECLDAYTAFAARVRLVDEEYLPRLLSRVPVVFEGAQGVLLDEWHGFHPHTTWSTTTTANPLTLLAEAGRPGDARRIGVLRTVTTRHGAGPLVTEDPGLGALLPERHNGVHPWQGAFRVGHLDLVATRYAVAATGGVDALVVTHADAPARLGRDLSWCTGYLDEAGEPLRIAPGPTGDLDRQSALTRRMHGARPVLAPIPGEPADALAHALGAPLAAVFSGPTRADARTPSRRVTRTGPLPRHSRV
ncbi:adenylosuccinate synthetase [Nocardiopsis sp. MG754419]|uniref:adenylosuccinate synthetase n=1 Tax=Nocardiopsis sp. MG754419 TaxID=2259865 RepID=UPI001BA54BB8|nr:adenylosuccinate synthetase [Nocardiopsis sp. MG754419]MBR8742547.1 adenylosuccinate synthetase [Nocardiopsis sp. MG754419]